MIIKNITLTNFRVFKRTHKIDLAPNHDKQHLKNKPIILFGGLNGSGKTSILTAVRLALYGRNATGTSLNNEQYKEYLSSLIHRENDEDEININSSSIQLCFEYNHHGEAYEYTVTRSWKKGELDKVKIHQGTEHLVELNSQQCQGFLNDLIPLGVADLFFFDGEKISELAEDDSGLILRTAVLRLLGLDIIERLNSDLAIFLKRSKVKAMPANVKKQIATFEEEAQHFENSAEKLEQEITDNRTSIISTKTEIQHVEQTLSQSGGAWAQSREQEQAKVDKLLLEKEGLEKNIRQELESSFPLSLAPNTMAELIVHLESEAELKKKRHIKSEINKLLNEAKNVFDENLTNSPEAMEHLANVANKFIVEDDKSLTFDISDRELSELLYQVDEKSAQSKVNVASAASRLKEIESEIEQASTNIARAPEQEQLQNHLDHIKALNNKLTKLLIQRKELIYQAKKAYRSAADTARKIQKTHHNYRAETHTAEAVQNAIETTKLLPKFSESLKTARIQHLESAFIESYKKLARKNDLKLSCKINPDTFEVNLIDENKSVISRKTLSAGEKQIYAIAILEALAKASGHKLPIIIDTPLGRLDSKHRDNLVNHYFPNASHQVILLSTDTEVDQQYLKWIENSISHSYQIQFDQSSKSSKLKPGYFWQDGITTEAV